MTTCASRRDPVARRRAVGRVLLALLILVGGALTGTAFAQRAGRGGVGGGEAGGTGPSGPAAGSPGGIGRGGFGNGDPGQDERYRVRRPGIGAGGRPFEGGGPPGGRRPGPGEFGEGWRGPRGGDVAGGRWPRPRRRPYGRGGPYRGDPYEDEPGRYGGGPIDGADGDSGIDDPGFYPRRRPHPVRIAKPAASPLRRTAAQPAPPSRKPPAVPRPSGVAQAPPNPPGPPTEVPNEVLFELRPNLPGNTLEAVTGQYRLIRIGAERIDLLDTTIYRYRVPAGQSPDAVVAALRGDQRVASAQPNGKFRLQDGGAAPAGASAPQWSTERLKLVDVHGLGTGQGVLVAMLDSGIDVAHPELAGSAVTLLDVLDTPFQSHEHGTAIAGALAAHLQLTGVAPGARILGIRTFDARAAAPGAEGTSIHIAKALDLADRSGTRVFNLSFAGPSDALLARMLSGLHGKGGVIVAAAGNAGPASPPLYPAADPNVIAVTATDSADGLYRLANRGAYICLAAPGVDILEPAPGGAYRLSSGTSVAAAEVSGVAALLLGRQPGLEPDAVRAVLVGTADAAGVADKPEAFGAGLVDALRAMQRLDAPPGATPVPAPAVADEARKP